MKMDSTLENLYNEQWDLVIEPKRSLLGLLLGELWRARDLIQPLLTTITFSVIFGGIAKLPTDGLPQSLFYMSGMVIWTCFASCITKTSDTFITNTDLFGKVYFPHLATVTPLLNEIIRQIHQRCQQSFLFVQPIVIDPH